MDGSRWVLGMDGPWAGIGPHNSSGWMGLGIDGPHGLSGWTGGMGPRHGCFLGMDRGPSALRSDGPWAGMSPPDGCVLGMDGPPLALRMDGPWAGRGPRHEWAPMGPRDGCVLGRDVPPYQKHAEYITLNSTQIYTTKSQKSLCHHETSFQI